VPNDHYPWGICVDGFTCPFHFTLNCYQSTMQICASHTPSRSIPRGSPEGHTPRTCDDPAWPPAYRTCLGDEASRRAAMDVPSPRQRRAEQLTASAAVSLAMCSAPCQPARRLRHTNASPTSDALSGLTLAQLAGYLQVTWRHLKIATHALDLPLFSFDLDLIDSPKVLPAPILLYCRFLVCMFHPVLTMVREVPREQGWRCCMV
jgi:hypothetical protein